MTLVQSWGLPADALPWENRVFKELSERPGEWGDLGLAWPDLEAVNARVRLLESVGLETYVWTKDNWSARDGHWTTWRLYARVPV